MKHLKLFEELLENKFTETPLYNYFIAGDTGIVSQNSLIDFISKKFKNLDDFKYKGKLYRYKGFYKKGDYEQFLKNPSFNSGERQLTSASKSLTAIKKFAAGVNYKKGYKYFVLTEFNVTDDDVFIDVNKLLNTLKDYNDYEYKFEEEVLVYIKNIKNIKIKNHGNTY